MRSSMFRTLFFVALFLSAGTVLAETTKPFKLAVTGIEGLEELQREFQTFEDKLTELSGVPIELYPISGRTVVVEALRSKRLDFALTGPAEYVVVHTKTDAYPLVGLTRPDYYSIIVVKSDSGITDLSQLKGKKVAFGDHGSTSYHLAPYQILSDGGVNPLSDIKAIHLAKEVAWQALTRGDVEAIGMSHHRYLKALEADSSVSEKDFRVIGKGPLLPDDLIVAGAHVPAEIREQVRLAFEKHGKELLDAMLVGVRNKKYEGMDFYTKLQDSDYDYVRKMYQTAGFDDFAEPSTKG
ncbi:MAG: phosphate/phosphite/phosphonate ABC transporter substrate-binding protein [Bdellovibrionales bacterium]|nr:phosphate/phosphite/phosphonate ABC transporter substrate-binding protein [Bdellovibrionales bacterium]